jgi:hypothetical protein
MTLTLFHNEFQFIRAATQGFMGCRRRWPPWPANDASNASLTLPSDSRERYVKTR